MFVTEVKVMIRRFFSILVFVCTVLTASFGQNIVGREKINHWAQQLRHEAPARGKIALHQTDIFMAQLTPEAGGAPVDYCLANLPENL